MLVDRINALARRVPVWSVWLILLVPAVWTFWLGLTGGLGAEPIKALERELGEVALQLLVCLVLDVQIPAQIWADIVKRPYVMVGFTAFLLMIPLALTSNDRSLRRLGPRWRQLHKLTYGVVVLGAVHFIWLSKGFQIEPLIYLAAILALLALRRRARRRVQRA